MKAIADNDAGGKVTYTAEFFDNLKGVFERAKELQNNEYEVLCMIDENLDDCLYSYIRTSGTIAEVVFLFKNNDTIATLKGNGISMEDIEQGLLTDFIHMLHLNNAGEITDPEILRDMLDECYEQGLGPELEWVK